MIKITHANSTKNTNYKDAKIMNNKDFEPWNAVMTLELLVINCWLRLIT